MIFLIAALLSEVLAQSDPAALLCAQKFVQRMSEVKGYSLAMSKKELSEGQWLEEPIEIWSEGPVIRYKFVADGSSGIKNNGFELTYDGSDILKIIWGEPTFLGAIKNKAAKALLGDSIPLTDEKMLKGEIFTLNRAGYRHLALVVRHHIPDFKTAKTGGLKGDCTVKHTPPALEFAEVDLKPEDRIQDLEEKYGTFAYHIRAVNAEKFPTLDALFKRKEPVSIRVPLFSLPFELDLDPESKLPRKLILFLEGNKIGEYLFSNVKSW